MNNAILKLYRQAGEYLEEVEESAADVRLNQLEELYRAVRDVVELDDVTVWVLSDRAKLERVAAAMKALEGGK